MFNLFLYADASNNPHHLCLLVYRMPKAFTPSIRSHGNSKDNRPFLPTWPSTLSRVKEESVRRGPKATVEHLSKEVGGMLGASGSGQMPRNEKQVSNAKKRCLKSGSATAADERFVVMQRAFS